MTDATPVNWDEVFRLTVKTMRQGLAVLDGQARILYANDALAELLGLHVDQLAGEPFIQLFSEDARPKLTEQIELRHQGQRGIYELAFTNITGRRIVSLVSAAPLFDEQGRLNCSVAVITDITERKQAEEEILGHHRRLRALSSELMLAEERERRRLATQLHDRIGHALALAKIKLERLDAEPEPERGALLKDIVKLVDSTIEDTRSLSFEICPPILHEVGLVAALKWLADQVTAQHDLAITFGHGPWEQPLGNEVRILLFQIAREILFNVVKHARAHAINVRLERDDTLIRLVIADDGIGFDVLEIAERSSKEGGYGLLSIRARMHHIGGECAIVSQPGAGTTVTITAPLRFAMRDGAGSSDRSLAAGGGPAVEPTTVLIVDDQQLMRQGLRKILQPEPGIEVVAEAANGQEALELVRAHAPDVVIMDIDMPVLDGRAATRLIMDEFPATRVIVLSMFADWQHVSQLLQAGAAGYLLKDCAAADLARAISAVRGHLTFLSPRIADIVVNELIQLTGPGDLAQAVLTGREREVLKLIAEGHSAKEIARELEVSTKTVYSFRSNILRKLGLTSDTELTRYALRAGLVDLER